MSSMQVLGPRGPIRRVRFTQFSTPQVRTFTASRRRAVELGPNETAGVKTDRGPNDSQYTDSTSSGSPRPSGRRWMYAGALTAGVGLYAFLQPNIHADDGSSSKSTKGPVFSKDDVSLLCIIGYPKSGKTTQCKNLEQRWGNEGWQYVKVDSIDALRKAIESRRKESKGKQVSLIVDGFPTSLEEAKAIESNVCKIFCYAYFGFEEDEYVKRTGGSAQDYKKLYKTQQPLREMPREEGNILEIVAAWPKDEVWEQVEAKVEQVIELREMGEM